MIAKQKANMSAHDTIKYNMKEESELLSVNNLEGDSIKDYDKQMRMQQRLFDGRANNLTAHIILSPSIEDGKKLSKEEFKAIANHYLKSAKLDTHQSLVFLHEDKDHKHLHIVASRVDENGTLYKPPYNERYMSQNIGAEIAKEMGLKNAQEIAKENKKLREQQLIVPVNPSGLNNVRDDLREARAAAGKEFNNEIYFNTLESKNYKIKKHLTEENTIKGYGITTPKGEYYNASDLGKEFTLTNLKQYNAMTNEQQQKHQQDYIKRQESEDKKKQQAEQVRLQEKASIETTKAQEKQTINNNNILDQIRDKQVAQDKIVQGQQQDEKSKQQAIETASSKTIQSQQNNNEKILEQIREKIALKNDPEKSQQQEEAQQIQKKRDQGLSM